MRDFQILASCEYRSRKKLRNGKKPASRGSYTRTRYTIVIQARTEDGERFIIIGKAKEKLHSCIFTARGGTVRLISARRSRKNFDEGKDIVQHLDVVSAKVRYPVQRINIDIPQEVLQRVDEEASSTGIPRTSLIQMWIVERMDNLKKSA